MKVNTNIQRAFVGAFKKEVSPILAKFKQAKKIKVGEFQVYEGQYQGVQTVLMLTGCGSVAAGNASAQLKNSYTELAELFNLGFVGSLTDTYSIRDVVQVEQVFNSSGELLVKPLVLHNILSKEKCYTSKFVVNTKKQISNIAMLCNAKIIDMELASICEVFGDTNIDISSIKIVSDYCNGDVKKKILNNFESLSVELEAKLLQVLSH